MDPRNIKLDPEPTLATVSHIAETVSQVAIPGPVPQASGDTPIDAALAAVADAQQVQADAWAAAVAATVPEDYGKSVNAVNTLETTEHDNNYSIGRVYPDSGGAGVQSV